MDEVATTKHLQAAINRFARVNHGVLWNAVLQEMGASKDQIQGLVERGYLRRAARGVLVVSAVPHSWEQDLLVQCRRAPGRAWVSGEAAGALLGLDGCRPGRIVITTTVNLRSQDARVRVKRARKMPTTDITTVRGIPSTTVDRTLIDLGDDLAAERVEFAYECSIRRGLTHPRRLRRRLESMEMRGRKGPATLRWIIEVQGEAPPTGSVLEVRFLQINRRAGLPTPIRQRIFTDRTGRIIRVDFLYPGTNVVVEVDGRSFHVRRIKYEEDLARRNRLTASGLLVLHVTYRRMKGDPDGVIAEIAEALHVTVVGK